MLASAKSFATILALLLLTGCQPPPEEIERVHRGPHSVLLLTLDTTRADHLQPYSSQHLTPALQELADEGIVMEHAYAVSPLTMPTHSSILTGLIPPQHGVRTNGRHRLDPTLTTLAEHFKEEGFRTAAFVSAAVLERRYGLDQGFDVYDDDLSQGKANEARMVSERPASATVDAARQWLDGLGDGDRFFLWVHLFDPHASYTPPSPYDERFRDQPYEGEISYMDAQIGRLLAHPSLAIDHNVTVAAIADHGESLNQHDEATHGLLAYDATLHIPWILRLAQGPRGFRFTPPVSQVDLLPTLLDLQGIEVDQASLAGTSLVPHWPGQASGTIEVDRSEVDSSEVDSAEGFTERPIYAESLDPLYLYGWEALRVLRRGPWKYIAAPAPELYQVIEDPSEETNLYASQGQRADRLARDLVPLVEASALSSENQLPIDADTRAKLESLGYTAVTQTRGPELANRLDPKDVIDLHHTMQQAEGLIAEGRIQTAEKLLRDILRRDPRNHQALVHLARLTFEGGDLEASITILQQGLTYYPGDTTLSLSLAGLEAQRGRFDTAVELGKLAMASEPRLLEPWLLVAKNLQAAGRSQEVAAIYQQALEYVDSEPELHTQIGLILAKADAPRAEAALRRAIEVSTPRRPQLHRALANLLAASGRDEEAQQERRLADQGAAPTSANARAEALASQGQLAEAQAIWERLLIETPDDAVPYGNLATLALQRGDWTTAKSLAQRAVTLDASLAPSWNALAFALEELGQIEDAANAYHRALDADPSYTTARFNLGLLLKKVQEFALAAEAFENLLRTEPEHWNAHFELILLYAGPLGDPARARPHLLRNLEAEPDHPKAPLLRDLLGRVDQAVAGGM